MTTAESHPVGYEVVVSEDGSIPAEILARYGFRPGSHLRLLPESTTEPLTPKGILADQVDPATVDAITDELLRAKAERIAVEREEN